MILSNLKRFPPLNKFLDFIPICGIERAKFTLYTEPHFTFKSC